MSTALGIFSSRARQDASRRLGLKLLTPEQAEELVNLAMLKDRFAARHEVRPCEYTVGRVVHLLRSGGADAARVYGLVQGNLSLVPSFDGPWLLAFKDPELWADRDGEPAILAAHPTGDPALCQGVYDSIAALGLEVLTDVESYRGPGSHQVLVLRHGLNA